MGEAPDIMSGLTEHLLGDLCVGMLILTLLFEIFQLSSKILILSSRVLQATSKMGKATNVMS